MRGLNYCCLLLASGFGLCRARHHAFSIHEDLLAYPQFEVVFSETFVREADALALIENATGKRSSSSTSTSTSDATSASSADATAETAAAGDYEDDFPLVSEKYKVINVPPLRYLCAIPVLASPPALNQTATDLAKAEEAREISRATAKGWELLQGLNGQCLYYVSGWWSYSFCYDRQVVQYHALPPGTKAGPPVRDERTPEYVLGQSVSQQKHNGRSLGERIFREGQAVLKQDDNTSPPPNTELVVKGDQRYLVQRLDSGTICDLTGRPRTIEIQFHCAPGSSADRIGWIKEVTTCTYLMMVQTPRLCDDVAFLPPKPTLAHPISCRQIVSSEEEVQRWHTQKTLDAKMRLTGSESQWQLGWQQQQQQQQQQEPDVQQKQGTHSKQQKRSFTGMNIGGVVIGGRNILGRVEDGQPAAKLSPPRRLDPNLLQNAARAAAAAQPFVELLAFAKPKSEGGNVEVVSDDDLIQLELDPAQVDELREELRKLAGDQGWKLEILEHANEVAEFRGVIHDPHDPNNDVYYDGGQANGPPIEDTSGRRAAGGAAGEPGSSDDDRRAVGNRDKGGKAAAAGRKAQKKQGRNREDKGNNGDSGSEEKFFKDEL